MSLLPDDDRNRTAAPCDVEPGWQVRTGLTLTEAERLLDHLETCGVTCLQTHFEAGTVTVRWQSPWPRLIVE